MRRCLRLGAVCIFLLPAAISRADVVIDWNETMNAAIIATPSKHNPGNPTRAMAMMNGAIYDIFQAVNRTHAPFKVNQHAPGADLNAAVARAAYLVLSDTYGEQQSMLDSVLNSRLGPGPYSRGTASRHRSGQPHRPALRRRARERWTQFARRLLADGCARSLGSRSDDYARPKGLGFGLGIRDSVGDVQSGPLRFAHRYSGFQ